jgi:hypothetical protein
LLNWCDLLTANIEVCWKIDIHAGKSVVRKDQMSYDRPYCLGGVLLVPCSGCSPPSLEGEKLLGSISGSCRRLYPNTAPPGSRVGLKAAWEVNRGDAFGRWFIESFQEFGVV